jgi:hypothetical protein
MNAGVRVWIHRPDKSRKIKISRLCFGKSALRSFSRAKHRVTPVHPRFEWVGDAAARLSNLTAAREISEI